MLSLTNKKLNWFKLDKVKCLLCPITTLYVWQTRTHWFSSMKRSRESHFLFLFWYEIIHCPLIMNLFFWPTVQFFKFQKGWRKRLFLSGSRYSSFLMCSQHFQVKHIHNKDGPLVQLRRREFDHKPKGQNRILMTRCLPMSLNDNMCDKWTYNQLHFTTKTHRST